MRVILITFCLLLISSQSFSKDELKFSTEKVRAMWYMCATQFQMAAPTIPQIERVRLCDCYVDHMRTTFTPEQVIALTSEQSRELGLKMNIICPSQAQFFIQEVT